MADKQEASFDKSNSEVNDEEQIVTMVDVLQDEQELEANAYAVLGGSDEKNCTYTKGYLKRQALYACITCIPESKTDPSKRAGICLACSYSCHEGHELIELYTKRNFRCDCGNSKFSGKKCNLVSEKSDINENNLYNHNFSGLYCTCERPYPDPEDEIDDEMIQCIACEDWYHCRHLQIAISMSQVYSEMICGNCISKHEFLLNYDDLTVNNGKKEENGIKIKEESNAPKSEEQKVEVQDSEQCKMPKLKSDTILCAKFWSENWRTQLCTCKKCKEMYAKQKIDFLIDLQDTVHVYEEKGKAKALENPSASQYEEGMKALSSLDRVQQVEAISEYNKMKDQLKAYLQKFAENKKIVREEDIREFFSSMTARKKQKVDIPHFCR